MEEQKKKKNKSFFFIMIPVVVLSAAAIVLGVNGRKWFGTETESTAETEVESTEEQTTEVDPSAYEGAIYWNVERDVYAYKSEAGLSSRTLDKDDGTYHILFASEGRQVTRRATDRKIVNQIDNLDVMGLVFGEDGTIVGVVPIENFTGGYAFKEFFVEKQEGTVVTLNSSNSFMGEEATIDTTSCGKIFDVAGTATYVGIELYKPEFAVGDKLTGVLDTDGNMKVVFRTYSIKHIDMYWNVERKWDAGNGVSSRTPDKDGVYTFLLAVNGEQVTVKVKDKAVVDAMDKVAAKSFGLTFDEDGFAISCITPTEVTHGKSIGSWYDIMELNGYDFKAKKTIAASDTGREVTGTIATDCEIYDVSGIGSFIGEKTTVRQYDRMQGYTGPDGLVHVLYVVSRKIDAPIYWNAVRKYDSKTSSTTREKEADGYYHIKMCTGGKTVELKTKDKALATKIDSEAARSLGIIQSNGIIQEVYSAGNVYSSKGSWYDITQIYKDGTIHVKKTITASDTGNQYDIEVAKDCKIYNVTETYQNNLGEYTSLRVGDRIQGWVDLEGKAKVIFIVNRDAKNPVTAHKTTHTCEECGENVTWTAWTSGSSLPTTTGHYYLTGSVACQQQSIMADQHVVLCMNGYNIRCTGKRLYATFEAGATLSLHDCTGKSRMFSSYEGDLGTTQGGLLWVRFGSISIYGGNYDISNQVMPNTGAMIDVSGGTSLSIYGGTFIGGETKMTGGIINVRTGGTFVLAGGTFTAGKAADHIGDAVYMAESSSLTISGKPVINGGTTQLYLAKDVKIKLKNIESGASLGISMEQNGLFTSNYEDGAENCFKSDDATLAVGISEGVLALGTTNVTKVTLDKTNIDMLKKAEEQLTATLEPADAISKITWSSSDESKATVDENGLVIAKADGEVTITATAANGEFATCVITIAGEAVRATGVKFEDATADVLVGATKTLVANVLPAETTVKRVTFESSDKTVATISEDGVVTALKEGTTTITVTTADGGFTDTCEVTVKAHVHCVCGGTCADKNHAHADITWIPWTSTSTLPTTAADSGKYYYLTEDVILGGQQMLAADANITICLNSHTVELKGNERLCSTFNAGSSLTITDCSENETGTLKSAQNVTSKSQQGNVIWVRYGTVNFYRGTIDATAVKTGGNGVAVNVSVGTTFNFYGGTIKGGTTTVTGGAVHIDGTMNMYGGTIDGGQAKFGGTVGINNANAVIKMYGGTIQNGKSVANSGGGQGGNVAISNGKFYFYDGIIKDGSSTGNHGGNVSLASANAFLYMSGGTITGGKSTSAGSDNIGSFYQAAAAFTMSGGKVDGGVLIATGYATIKGTANISGGTTNLTLANGIKLAVSDLQEGANICLTMANPGVFTANKTEAFMKYFHSDAATYEVQMTTSGMALGMAATDMSLDKETATISAGETLQLTATTTPLGLTNILWSSDNEDVATVSATGLVEAVADGTATISAEISGIKKTCALTVHTFITSISVEVSSMMVGKTAQSIVTFNPTNASNKAVTYDILDKTVATVDANGLVTGVAIGSTTLTVTSVEDATKTASATVTVTEFIVPVESISLDKETATVDIDKTLTLTATVLPETASYPQVTWSSSDETKATVENGVVTPLKSGEVTITATVTSDTSKKASCVVTIKGHEHCVCGGTADLTGHATHASVEWTPWTKNNELPNVSGYYYLTTDVTYNGAQYSQNANTDIKICLNGHTITRAQAARVISVFNSGANLTLTDCAEKAGTVKVMAGTNAGVQGGGVWVRSGGVFNMFRITIDASGFVNSTSNGSAICVENTGVANIYSGTVKGGQSKYGATVFINGSNTTTPSANGTLNFYSGLITGGKSFYNNGGGQGGNVYVCGNFNMYGGEIRDGQANGNGGGNVAILTGSGRFVMTDGLITGGATTNIGSANVFITGAVDGAFKMSGGTITGDVVISKGLQEISGTAKITGGLGKNLWLASGVKIKVGTLTEGAQISVSMAVPGDFATNVSTGMGAFFKADKKGETVTETSGTLTLNTTAHADHCVCGGAAVGMTGHTCGTQTWTAWTSTNSLPIETGYYYLTTDVKLNGQQTVSANAKVYLCLNGFDIVAPNETRVYGVNNAGGLLSICDCRGYMEGETYHAGRILVMGGNPATPMTARQALAIFLLGSGGDATMYGGIIDARSVYMKHNEGVAVMVGSGRTFTMYGGVIYGGTNTANGSAVYSNGTFNMNGGTIIGKKANKGGAVYQNAGTFTMNGGTITGGNAAEGGAVRVHTGTFTMNGGLIQNGTATAGGNIFLNINTTFNMKGGVVTGGVATGFGGNIAMNAANGYNGATINMSDGVISNGTAQTGGNVSVRTSGSCVDVLNMTGGVITGGKATEAGTENVYEGGTVNKTGGTIE